MRFRVGHKILLFIACVLYAGFLTSFVLSFDYGILGFGVGMGIAFLLILFISVPGEKLEAHAEELERSGGEPVEGKVNVNSLIDQLARRREELESANEEIKAKDEEIERLKRRLDDDKQEYLDLESKKRFFEEKVTSLESSLKDADSKAHTGAKEIYETILPDAKNDPPKVINIGEAAEHAVNDLKASADAAGIVIRTVSTDATLMVKASPVMIDILFKNIIDNAIKYMSKEGTLQITISRIEHELFVVMKDNGEGLSSDETEHIFELNYQGSNRISGNGLGLAQARAIVEYYGGMIYARSNRGSGMGIYIHLPSAV